MTTKGKIKELAVWLSLIAFLVTLSSALSLYPMRPLEWGVAVGVTGLVFIILKEMWFE